VTGGGDAAAIDADAPRGLDGDAMLGGCAATWFAGTVHFGTPARLAELDVTGFERDPFLSPDELTIYYSSNQTGSLGGSDIYTATRSAIGATFGTASKFGPANSTSGYEGKLAMTPDGQIFVVSSNRTGGTGLLDDIWIDVRGNAAAPWPAANQMHLQNVDDNNYQEDPVLSDDGLHLYVAPSDAVHQHVAFSSRTSRTSDFTTPTVIAELDSNTGEADPALAFDERLIVFSSSRAGSGDLFYATRTDKTAAFAPPVALTELNSIANEGDPWLSPDGCRLYFASDTLAAGYTLWVAAVL
jgi:Tol biopolymer transport system component